MISWRLRSVLGLLLVLGGACGGSDEVTGPNNTGGTSDGGAAGDGAGGAASGAGGAQAGGGLSGGGQAGAGQAGSGLSGNGNAGSGQAGSGQAGSGLSGNGNAGSGQAGSGQAGSGQAGSGQSGSGDAGSGQAGSGQAGSGNAGSGNAGSGNAGSGGAPSLTVGGDRPTTLHLPKNYDPTKPAPLLMMLHGRSVGGDVEEAYLGLTKEADAQGFLYVHPSGTIDAQGQPFWNATDACCNFFGSTVDDEAYLMGMLDEIASKWSVDPKRVYLMGHSNGGFMSYRLACHHAERFAAIAVLAGEMYKDTSQCQPTSPVSVLHIQGTADATIAYGGGSVAPGTVPEYPSAETSVKDWVGFNGCGTTGDTSAPPLDLDASLPGPETSVTRYSGCQASAAVELWTIAGGGHIPSFGPAFAPTMTGWLLERARP